MRSGAGTAAAVSVTGLQRREGRPGRWQSVFCPAGVLPAGCGVRRVLNSHMQRREACI